MIPKNTSQAGTLESSDILVMIEPIEKGKGRIVELDSTVIFQYGKDILKEINTQLDKFEVSDIRIIAKDKGALSATISARVETALKRSFGTAEGTLQ